MAAYAVLSAMAGLVRLHTRGGHRVEILPRYWDSYDRGIAAGMYLHDMIYIATERAARRQMVEDRVKALSD